MNYLEVLKKYHPADGKEAAELSVMRKFAENNPDCLLRTNLNGHFTASSWVVNESHDRVLFCYHKIYDSWSWLGGHADGCADLGQVAVKEAFEESGITCSLMGELPISVEILPVSGHIKKDLWVPSHLHYNFTYLLVADENSELLICEEENSGLGWFSYEEAINASSEKWLRENVYLKLINKIC